MTFFSVAARRRRFFFSVSDAFLRDFPLKNNDFQWILHQHPQKKSPGLRPGCCETRGGIFSKGGSLEFPLMGLRPDNVIYGALRLWKTYKVLKEGYWYNGDYDGCFALFLSNFDDDPCLSFFCQSGTTTILLFGNSYTLINNVNFINKSIMWKGPKLILNIMIAPAWNEGNIWCHRW